MTTKRSEEAELDSALRALLLPDASAPLGEEWPDLDGFECLTRLGQGGMGAVYLAQQALPRRLCTVKLVPKWEGQAIEREAHLSARLEHPGIARVYSVSWLDDALAIVGEWVDGFPLSEVLRIAPKVSAASDNDWVTQALLELESDDGSFNSEGLPPPAAVVEGWMREVASALSYAHDRGVTHCDIKPSNLMLRRDGRVVLIDFGIATMGDVDSATEGGFVGSFGYAAPEQLLGKRARIGPGTDAYSMGATFLHLLSGTRPFPVESLAERVERFDQAPEGLGSGASRKLDALLSQMLVVDVSDRLADMDQVLRILGDDTPSTSRSGPSRGHWLLLKGAFLCVTLLLSWTAYQYSEVNERLEALRIQKRDVVESLRISIVRHSVAEAFRRHLTQCFVNEGVEPSQAPRALRLKARMTLEGLLSDVKLEGEYAPRVRFCVLATLMKVRIPSSRYLDRRDVTFEIQGDSWR